MRLRLILSYALIVLVTVVTVVLIARKGAANEVRAYMFRGRMIESETLVGSLEAYYRANGSWQGVSGLLPATQPARQGQGMGQGMMHGQGMSAGMMSQRLRVADADGRVAADTFGAGAGETLSAAELKASLPLENDGRTVGYLLPEGGMGFDVQSEQILLARLARAGMVAGLVGGALSLLLAGLLTYSLLRPVRELTRAAGKLGAGDLSQRVKVRGKDEVAGLGASFNQMADSLQEAQESRRAMTADIAHELRNPLAVQRAHLEAIQDGVYPLSGDSLQPVLDQNLMLTRLVEDLRTLALAESGQLKLERQDVDLAALVQQVIERFRPQAEAHGVTLQVNAGVGIPLVRVDPLRVEQILGNLLSNALRYSPQGGQILLALSQSGGAGHPRAQVQVHDQGPGIPAEALEHIFERFYRADRARSRAEGGSGLGLAIARQLAEAHGGSLTVANHPQGGAVFTLELPTAAG